MNEDGVADEREREVFKEMTGGVLTFYIGIVRGSFVAMNCCAQSLACRAGRRAMPNVILIISSPPDLCLGCRSDPAVQSRAQHYYFVQSLLGVIRTFFRLPGLNTCARVRLPERVRYSRAYHVRCFSR